MSFDRENASDAEFERSLLESARKDAPPHSADQAWTRFASTLSLVAPSPGPGNPWSQGPARATNAEAASKAAGARVARMAAMKWLLLGAIGGGAVTAVVLEHRDAKPIVLPAVYNRLSEPSAQLAACSHTPSPGSESDTILQPRIAPSMALTIPSGHPHARPIPSAHKARSAVSTADDRAPPFHLLAVTSSTLAAEVSRIDAARAANLDGAPDEAIRLIERYHQDFPKGALAPDADVVALEALAAKRDSAEIARRAARFLSQYPDDPHALRVRGLVEH